MAYQELKESLEKLLSEDINNRSSIQEMRRNVYLSSENQTRHQEEIQHKENSIRELSSLIDSKKNLNTTLQAKISSLTEELTDERESHRSTVENFEAQLQLQSKEIEVLKAKLEESSNQTSEISGLMLQNEEYAGKIRDLIYHVDELNTKAELIKQEAKNQEFEVEVLNEKIDALNLSLSESEQKNLSNIESTASLQDKIALQDNQIESFKLLLEASKTENQALLADNSKSLEFEEIINGWKADKELVDNDNAELIAQTELLSYENGNLLFELNELKNESTKLNNSLVEAEGKFTLLKESVEKEKNELNFELELLKEQTKGMDPEAQHKISSLTDELRLMQIEHEHYQTISKGQLSELKGKFEVMEFEKNELVVKLDHLSKQLEDSLASTTNQANAENEAFIEKLFKQIDGLNEEKRILAENTESASEEINFLKNKLEELSQLFDSQSFETKDLEESNNPSKLAEAVIFSNEEKTAMNTRITELVREIDRCLALLNV